MSNRGLLLSVLMVAAESPIQSLAAPGTPRYVALVELHGP
jgi:hypothetical protein